MANRERRVASIDIQRLFRIGNGATLADGQLLDRFRDPARDRLEVESAFASLVERHGPMVLRVCRGVLGDEHAAEDAFQGTFLILARKAGSIGHGESVASWLFGVARRVALRARLQRDRHDRLERRAAEALPSRSGGRQPPDFLPEIHEEIDRLRELYRAPIVLCYVEGLGREEAAQQLRVPVGTLKVRLSRAREQLKVRLARRGLDPSRMADEWSGALGGLIPSRLADSTVKAADRDTSGDGADVPASVSFLVQGVLRAMLLTKIKASALLALTSLAVVLAVAWIASIPARSEPVASLPGAKEARPALKPQGPGQAERRVSVETVRKSNLRRTSSQIGAVEAAQTLDLSPGVSGVLRVLNVEIGDRVTKGQILAEIDAPDLALDSGRARALLEQAEARLLITEATVKAAESALRSLTTLPPGAVSKQQIFEVEGRLEVARGETLEARAGVRVAQVNLQKTVVALTGAKIVAPWDGVVFRRHLDPGNFVRSGYEPNARPVLTLIKTDIVRVVVGVPDRDVLLLKKGAEVTILLVANGGRLYRGTIARTAFAEDPARQTLRAEIDLDNADGQLRPGQFGSVTIVLQERRDVLTVPRSAIVQRQGDRETACFRVEGGRAVRTSIETGAETEDRVEVIRGLSGGDVVISDPGPENLDGRDVVPTEAGRPGKD